MTGWADALLALACLREGALGLVLRARHGPVRDRFLALLSAQGRPIYRLAPESDAGPLRGERDLLGSLAARRAVNHESLSARCAGRVLLVPGAERVGPEIKAILCQMLDDPPPDCSVVLIDESDDHAFAPGLDHRLPLVIDLDGLALADCTGAAGDGAPDRLEEGDLAVLVEAVDRLGIDDPRIALHALGIARIAAQIAGREAALGFSARCVLASRATAMPQGEEPASGREANDSPSPPDPHPSNDPAGDAAGFDPRELVVEAAAAAIDPRLLEAGAGPDRRPRWRQAAQAHLRRRAPGSTGAICAPGAGRPGGGLRLDLFATLVAAAPDQHRGAGEPLSIGARHVRVAAREPRQRQATVFAIDASGSAALARLAEVKGAVETLLAESYVRRDEAALVAFRAGDAELVLPRTRSLSRASRLLSGLVGGGGTPLAAGIASATRAALQARAAGRAPLIVVVTDGDANQTLAGATDRPGAMAEALDTARVIARLGLSALVVDCAARPRPFTRDLAAAMRARHFALPRVERGALSAAARAAHVA